jgi:uncharacterized protein (DUF885 family)
MKKRKWIAAAMCLLLVLPLASCGGNDGTSATPYPSAADAFWTEGDKAENEKFTTLTNNFFHDVFKNDMVDLHYTVKDLAAYGFERPAMDLFATADVDYEQVLIDLQEIDYDKLSKENQVTYDIMAEDLSDALQDNTAPIASYFDYNSGVQTSLVTIATEYEFFEVQDIEDYLTMLSQMPEYFDMLYDLEVERAEAGYALSDEVLEEVIQQFKDVYGEGEESCFISSFNERIDAFDGLTSGQKEEYKARNQTIVIGSLFPAYQATAEKLTSLSGMGIGNVGVCYYSGGKDYYASLVKAKAGYSGTPDALYNDLVDFYTELQTELYVIAYTSRQAYNSWLKGEYTTLTEPKEILDYFSTHLDGYFPAIGTTTYTIKYLSESVANTKPDVLAYYMNPQIDNYQSGSITINGYVSGDDDAMSTLAHEGYPGHLYQSVYFLSKTPDPARSCFSFLGYEEGWAVYASNQAEYIYQYAKYDDVYSQLNEIYRSMNYTLYALVDVGVNYYGWSANDIIRNVGLSSTAASSLYDVFVKMPGVYLSYGAGNMQMYSLRDYAEEREGDRFDVVDFHRFVLDVGPCNFSLLQKYEKEYYTLKLTAVSE